MSIRPATHSGSWYLSKPENLSRQLKSFFDKAKGSTVKGAKVIISPHAGYTYCGSTMAKCYSRLDFDEDIERVFILGPSHHFYFQNKALISQYKALETPLGELKVDVDVVTKLLESSNLFGKLDPESDEDEHSLEMQFPMLYHTIKVAGVDPTAIKVVPILISHNSSEIDYAIGKQLSTYLKEGNSIVIVSSDFCHWGRRFGYTGYVASSEDIADAIADGTEIETLTARSKIDHCIEIWKSIELLDRYAMDILADKAQTKDKYPAWKDYLDVTGNTICGEKPIGVMLCALSALEKSHHFRWVGYAQSSHVWSLKDSSVSYAAGYCQI
ncbi:HBR356Wp [Eremothecium sinecaudum]|uniref:HBR356Wp n=1 Tax=Eremothecium sinecaudum TaxID=45286 RepID=A0A109UXR0_9SACH|nr:HBR356Wp [Eremothecium sinecaudum]AMD19257.1 HBR356Wp [Eremothecium sinecaudum]